MLKLRSVEGCRHRNGTPNTTWNMDHDPAAYSSYVVSSNDLL